MIHPLNEVKIIDIGQSKTSTPTLDKLYQELMYQITPGVTKDGDRLLFANKLLIQEGYGWTELQSITKVPRSQEIKWLSFRVGPLYVTVSEDELLPIYTPEVTRPGFHGRVLHAYRLFRAKDVKPGAMVRLIATDKSGEQFQAIESVEEHSDNHLFLYGFNVTTKSGLYASNNINLHGREIDQLSDTIFWN